MTLGESIRSARQNLGLTQADLAHQFRVTRFYISRLERGHKQPKKCERYRLWAELNKPHQENHDAREVFE